MLIDYLKAALMAGWILAVGGIGYALGTTSVVGGVDRAGRAVTRARRTHGATLECAVSEHVRDYSGSASLTSIAVPRVRAIVSCATTQAV